MKNYNLFSIYNPDKIFCNNYILNKLNVYKYELLIKSDFSNNIEIFTYNPKIFYYLISYYFPQDNSIYFYYKNREFRGIRSSIFCDYIQNINNYAKINAYKFYKK